jgi:hypothetical protein
MLRSRKTAAESHAKSPNDKADYRQPKRIAPVKPSNVLTLTGDSASLSVKRGALIAARDTITLVYEPRAVKPRAIVMTGWGGVIALAAAALLRQA